MRTSETYLSSADVSVEWGRSRRDSVSATVGEDDSEETGDGAEDGDNPHALTCAAH